MPQTSAADPVLVETEERLVARWTAAGVATQTVRDAVAEAVDRLADARVRSFLPILVERSVALRLAGAA